MAPLTEAPFDDWTASSIWPKPIFLLAAGSVALLILFLRRRLTSRRYLTYVNNASTKCKTDEKVPLSDLPPPLRSIYCHQEGSEVDKNSSVLAAEAAIRQLSLPQNFTTPPSRRHSCPYPASLLDEHSATPSPPAYSQLTHDSVQIFPVLDDEGKEMTDGYWRRRTLVYA